MTIQLYKILHFVGISLAFMGLVGILGLNWGKSEGFGRRMLFALTHGVGMLLTLVTGFGLSAKMGYTSSFPGWIIGLIIVWVLTGASYVLVKRFSQLGVLILIWFTVLLAAGAWLAILKPFLD